MKNFKLYAILGLCFGMLFLTACGGSDKKTESGKEEEKGTTPVLTCDVVENGQNANIKFTYNKDETRPESISMVMKTEIPDGVSDDDIELAQDAMEQMFCTNSAIKCSVKRNGNFLDVTLSGKLDDLVSSGMLEFDEDEGTSLADVQKSAEEDGATCTKSYE